MAINYPGPYEVEYSYLVSSLPHVLRVNCALVGSPAIGTAMSAIQVQTRGGTPANLETSVYNFWQFVRPFFNTGVSVTGIKLWRYTAGTFAKTFMSAYAGTAVGNGSNAGATVLAQETILTFVTALGGSMKLTFLETQFTGLTKSALVANAAGTDVQKLANYTISTAGWMLARDDSYPIAPVFQSFGQNEATFRARYR